MAEDTKRNSGFVIAHEPQRSSAPIIAGVFGLVALALAIVGALVFVDHINLAGTHASAPQQQTPSPTPAPAPAVAPNNAAPVPPEKKN